MTRQHQRVFLLLDRFSENPMAEYLAELTSAPPASLPLDDQLFAEDLDRAPLLVELLHSDPAHYGILQQSIALAQEQSMRTRGLYPVCAWLFTDASLSQIRVELTKRLNARFSQHWVYFRYFDPRVIRPLAAILPPTNTEAEPANSSFADLLGPINTWCLLDGTGHLVQYLNPTPSKKNSLAVMHFDEKTSAVIERIEAVNLAVDELESRNLFRTQDEDGSVDWHLQEAWRLGLRDLDDRVAYAWRALAYGETFVAHQELEAFIVEATKYGVPLEYLLQERLPDIG